MFTIPTVFILGAGASWHYGYPTGEQLVKRVISKAEQLAQYFKDLKNQERRDMPSFLLEKAGQEGCAAEDLCDRTRRSAVRLADRLKLVNPTVVDYFLKQNADLQEIGKLAIAMVLFDCEAKSAPTGPNWNHREVFEGKRRRGVSPFGTKIEVDAFADDWVRFVLYKLTSRCEASSDLLENKVTFVTFNYDVSLERRLYQGLKNISLFHENDIKRFFSDERFLHVYGKVRNAIRPKPDRLSTDAANARNVITKSKLQRCYRYSLELRTIDGPEKESDGKTLATSRDALSKCENLYVLGYGFDVFNSQRIGLTPERYNDPLDRSVFFTNFGGHNRVAMAAARAFSGDIGKFLSTNPVVQTDSRSDVNGYRYRLWNMSTKNVYDALNEDFESLETD